MLPVFSAAYSAKLQDVPTPPTPQSHDTNHDRTQNGWKRVNPKDADRQEWGFYLDLLPQRPSPPPPPPVSETSSSSTSTLTRTVATARERSEKSGSATNHVWATLWGRRSHGSDTTTMAPKIYTWISLWFLLTVPVIFWDAGYCFMRPRSMKGGDLHWIWKPYEIYQEIDYIYGVKALQEGDGFPNAQSLLNVVETVFNVIYLYLAHVASSPTAPLVGFGSVTMTLSKTVLYWLQEYYCGGCSVGHNTFSDLFIYWIIPNGLWLVFPSLIIYQLGSDISEALHISASSTKKKQ